ncbi:MAG: S-layer homology domain-containing protein, partial [Bacillota bacterium]|nr:S-layer homology domain-containing protein [Bacillota bacterium]
HNIYRGESGDFYQGPVWYSVYVNYAIANGILRDGDFADYDRPATRGEMAYILASAVPGEALEQINTVAALPDVTAATPYSHQIFALYRAGVLTGYTDHSYHPGETISRSETAAIIARIADAALRETF